MRKLLYENFDIFHFHKRIVSAEILYTSVWGWKWKYPSRFSLFLLFWKHKIKWSFNLFITDCKIPAMFDLSVCAWSSSTFGCTSSWWAQWANSEQYIPMLFVWATKHLWYGQNATWNLEKLCFHHGIKWTYI